MESEFATGAGRIPRIRLPHGACECHSHIYEPGIAYTGTMHMRRMAPVAGYRRMLYRLGFSRCVIVQSSQAGFDNSPAVDAIAAVGKDRARGVAVVSPCVTDAEIERLHDAGIRGVRFSYNGKENSLRQAPAIADKIVHAGWHLQVSSWKAASAPLLTSLPVAVVVDHLGRTNPAKGFAGEDFQTLLSAYRSGRVWVKISAPYYSSLCGAPDYTDFGERVKALAAIRDDRLVWGANWPHPTLPPQGEPEEADWLDRTAEWLSDDASFRRVMVDNPAVLYGFGDVA